jgi:phage-related protein
MLYSREGSSERKPLFFVGSSLRDLQAMPEDVKDVFGAALLDVQYGDTPRNARRYGEGLPNDIKKIVEDHDGDTYRAAYTVAFPGAVYVLDVYQKKSRAGAATPKQVKRRVLARFNAAQKHYAEQFGG